MIPGSGNYLQDMFNDTPKLIWECRICNKELDGDDPEGDLCKECKQKQEEEHGKNRGFKA